MSMLCGTARVLRVERAELMIEVMIAGAIFFRCDVE